MDQLFDVQKNNTKLNAEDRRITYDHELERRYFKYCNYIWL